MPAKRPWRAVGFSGGPWATIASASAAAIKQRKTDNTYIYNTDTTKMYDTTGEEVTFLTGSQTQAVLKTLVGVLAALAVGTSPPKEVLTSLLIPFTGSFLLEDAVNILKGALNENTQDNDSGSEEQPSLG